jgi:hypothetical protein
MVLDGRELHGLSVRGSDVPALTHFLGVHAAWLSTHPAGTDVADELEASAMDLAAIATPSAWDGTSLGSCPLEQEIDGRLGICGGQVRTTEDQARCARCGTSGSVQWWEHAIMPEASRLVTAKQLVGEVHQQFGRRIVEATIRQWVSRGVIVSVGKDEQGRSLYDKGQVAKALSLAEIA